MMMRKKLVRTKSLNNRSGVLSPYQSGLFGKSSGFLSRKLPMMEKAKELLQIGNSDKLSISLHETSEITQDENTFELLSEATTLRLHKQSKLIKKMKKKMKKMMKKNKKKTKRNGKSST